MADEFDFDLPQSGELRRIADRLDEMGIQINLYESAILILAEIEHYQPRDVDDARRVYRYRDALKIEAASLLDWEGDGPEPDGAREREVDDRVQDYLEPPF